MSAITNNIAFHTNHGDAPAVTPTNIVLQSISIALHKRWPDPDPVQAHTNEVVKSVSIALKKRWPEGELYTSPNVMRSMSLGYYGWKYLNQSVEPIPATPPMAIPIHHK